MLLAQPDAGWYTLDHRETQAEAVERVAGIATWLRGMCAEAAKGSSVALVVHGDLLNMLLRELLGGGGGARFLHYNTALSCVELQADGACVLLYQNCIEHLPKSEMRTGDEMLAVVS